MISDEEKVRVYEAFLHRIDLYRTCRNKEKLVAALDKISNWSYAHRMGNGKYSDEEQDRMIENTFEEFKCL